MGYYFRLQYRMFCRHLSDFGIHPFLGMVLLATAFLGLSFYMFYKYDFAAYGYVLFAITLTGQLSETSRNHFLKACFPVSAYQKLRLIENTIASIPFIAFLLWEGEYGIALSTGVIVWMLTLFHFERKWNLTLPTPFSRYPYEFAIGFRKTYLLAGFAYFLTGMAILHTNFNLGIFSLLVLFLLGLVYYSMAEPLYFVWIYTSDARGFLWQKIKVALVYTFGWSVPVFLSLAVFFPTHILILSGIFGLGFLYVIAMIVGKYVLYPSPINLLQGTMIALSVWFPPLLLLVIPYFYVRSVRQLKPLLE